MATISQPNLTIVKDTANAKITVKYTITWDAFDQATNLAYRDRAILIGDDTNSDGDDQSPGDDVLTSVGATTTLSSNGAQEKVVERTKTIALSLLNEDKNLNAAGNDDEIRVKVFLTPQVPNEVTRQSPAVTPPS